MTGVMYHCRSKIQLPGERTSFLNSLTDCTTTPEQHLHNPAILRFGSGAVGSPFTRRFELVALRGIREFPGQQSTQLLSGRCEHRQLSQPTVTRFNLPVHSVAYELTWSPTDKGEGRMATDRSLSKLRGRLPRGGPTMDDVSEEIHRVRPRSIPAWEYGQHWTAIGV